jgi:hypothetical protein
MGSRYLPGSSRTATDIFVSGFATRWASSRITNHHVIANMGKWVRLGNPNGSFFDSHFKKRSCVEIILSYCILIMLYVVNTMSYCSRSRTECSVVVNFPSSMIVSPQVNSQASDE